MTDGEEEWPNEPEVGALRRLDPGDGIAITYLSQRSHNEIGRSGEVTYAGETVEGDPLVRLHTGRNGPNAHQYVALSDATTEGGEECVGAWSVSAESEPPNGGDPPRLNRRYTVRFEPARTSVLGRVVEIRRPGAAYPNFVIEAPGDGE